MDGWVLRLEKSGTDITPLLDAIVKHIPAPKAFKGTPQMLITSLDFSNYVGRIAVGKLHRGELVTGQTVALAKSDGTIVRSKIKELYTFEGLGKAKTEKAESGEICAVVGIEGFEIGDSICDMKTRTTCSNCHRRAYNGAMLSTINNSPFLWSRRVNLLPLATH